MSGSGPHQSAGQAPKRVALYCGRKSQSSQLTEYIRRQGWQVAAEARPGDGPDNPFQQLLDQVVDGRLAIDMVMVTSLTDAFDTAVEVADALERLHRLGVDFRSYSEPFVDTTRYPGNQLARLAGAFARLDDGGEGAASACWPDGLMADLAPNLDERLKRFLDLQIDVLTAQRQAALKEERRARVRRPVGQLLTLTSILVGFALAAAAASSPSLIGAVIHGDQLVGAVTAGTLQSVDALSRIPDPVRAAAFALLWPGVTFIARSSPLRLRMALGSIVFAALVNLVVLALAAAIGTWFPATLTAAIGLALLVLVIYEFCALVISVASQPSDPARAETVRTGVAEWLDSTVDRIDRFFVRIHPSRWRLGGLAFVGLPLVSVTAELAAVVWPPVRIGFPAATVFAAWVAWGIGATSPALRIPIWSILGWTLVIIFVLDKDVAASTLFLMLALAVLLVSCAIAIFRWPPAPIGDGSDRTVRPQAAPADR